MYTKNIRNIIKILIIMSLITIPKITNANNHQVIHTSKTKKLKQTNQDVLINKPTKPILIYNPNNSVNNYKEIKFDTPNVDKDFQGYNYSNSNIVIIPYQYHRSIGVRYILINR